VPTERAVATAQAGFYLTSGIWPLLDRGSFERVTGPKSDFWLVQTVGLCVASIGLGLASAVRRGRPVGQDLRVVAVSSALGLAAVDLVFVSRGRISKVYLLDAAVETVFALGWLRRANPDRG
jgi:hypothetical protein